MRDQQRKVNRPDDPFLAIGRFHRGKMVQHIRYQEKGGKRQGSINELSVTLNPSVSDVPVCNNECDGTNGIETGMYRGQKTEIDTEIDLGPAHQPYQKQYKYGNNPGYFIQFIGECQLLL